MSQKIGWRKIELSFNRSSIPSVIADLENSENKGQFTQKIIHGLKSALEGELDEKPDAIVWNRYDYEDEFTRPKEYGRYLVYRESNEKIHFETWNGSGWAYNNKTITWYANQRNLEMLEEIEK